MRMSRLATWSTGILAAGLTVTVAIAAYAGRSPARAQQSGGDLNPAQLARLQSMQGDFVYESGPLRPELWKAIEAGTRERDPAQARRTRAQLEQLLAPPPHVELMLETAAVPTMAIQEGRSQASAPLTGEARAIVSKGARADAQPLQLSQRLSGSTLVRVVEGKGFRQERSFTLGADGATLTLEIRISGAALPSPLSSSATYRRL
jgi:hypothetical protein